MMYENIKELIERIDRERENLNRVIRPIPTMQEYAVSISGKVYSTHTLTEVAQWDNGKGYKYVTLMVDGKGKRNFKVSRLVAIAFLPKDDYHTDVDHIDGCKSNNNISNLQWLTHKDNVQKYYEGKRNAVRGV